MSKIILGSSSAFRKAQLTTLGVEFECYSPDIDEDAVKEMGLTPLEVSKHLSKEKALAVKKKYPTDIIISGDQVLEFEGEIFNKPLTNEKAMETLSRLQGKSHQLITSICIIKGEEIFEHTVIAKMKMRELTKSQIENYVLKDEPLWSCGAYKLETLGIALFEEIECKDHSSIIGLPLLSVASTLMKLGVNIL
ncbi:septum formation protein Maf [Bacteriovorax sp. BSW11_IV]|uniref:Maf family protein n=1 Tax=Bacteriovorax sp. BSW11_IV TaxID=1353529 RepID=UPI000389E8BE|nr:Maf family protein [Bacteriovorax sp. BSW11_IV]EQC49324.1 septum formation protein Maf [Bacteriovorax sp. BSW11_IV]